VRQVNARCKRAAGTLSRTAVPRAAAGTADPRAGPDPGPADFGIGLRPRPWPV